LDELLNNSLTLFLITTSLLDLYHTLILWWRQIIYNELIAVLSFCGRGARPLIEEAQVCFSDRQCEEKSMGANCQGVDKETDNR
jgi:hypothetical protein